MTVDESVVERAQGCLLGQFAGDALGSMVEFMSTDAIRQHYPGGLCEIGPSPVFHTLAGQPTDDSELALALARALLDGDGFDDERVAEAYGTWLESAPFDVGGTIGTATRAILAASTRSVTRADAARDAANRRSEANGALMRQSPLAVWGYALAPEALAAVVRRDTLLTHPNRVCQDASVAFIIALAAVIREGLDAKQAYARALAWDEAYGESPTVTAALCAARDTLPDYETNQGHVLIALQNAFYQALHAPTIEEGVVATVMGGGDTDTNAAIAGALVGALHGGRAIPDQWRHAVLTCRPQEGAAGVQQPRPQTYWPVEALILAERLLAVGTHQRDESTVASHSSTTRRSACIVADADVPESAGPVIDAGDGTVRASSRTGGHVPTQDRFVGALLGGAIGDALGRPNEGSRSASFEDDHPRHVTDYRPWRGWTGGPIGTITDDTQMTMCVAACLVANGYLDPVDLARRFVAWLPVGRGKGEATTRAVTRLQAGVPWEEAGEDSAGNGAAMRAAPIGLVRWNDPERLRREAILSAMPTHREPMAVAGAVAMAAATAWLLTRQGHDWTPEEFVTAVQRAIAGIETAPPPERRDPSSLTTLHDRIGEVPGLLVKSPRDALGYLYGGAFVLESLPAALYCFLRSPNDVEQTLLLAANAGYDTDTIAALAGTLGGALGGIAALPQRLLPELEYRDELTALGVALHRLA
jgi:ADP-ribosylglycohydrolase